MRKILAILLILVMCLSLMPLTVFAAADEDVVYTDTRGNEITIPGGAKSCATKVVEFTKGNPWTSDEKAMNPNDILSVPNYNASEDSMYLCLGAGGSIILEFDIFIVDGEGNDIYVFEIGPKVEATTVEVSPDLKAFNIGAVNGSSATTFSPNALLNREQAAAMLTRQKIIKRSDEKIRSLDY